MQNDAASRPVPQVLTAAGPAITANRAPAPYDEKDVQWARDFLALEARLASK